MSESLVSDKVLICDGVFIGPFCNIYGEGIIGDGTKIGAYVEIGNPTVGPECKIQAYSFIPPGISIEARVFIGPGVRFTNDPRPRAFGPWDVVPTVVCSEASIGSGAIILPGVTIGSGATVGAGAVVTHSVPPGETWYGVPARAG